MKKRNLLQIVLVVIALLLAYLLYESIMKPVRFNEEVSKREAAIIEKLKDIRTMQQTYKSVNGKYAGGFDTLVDFFKNGKLPIIKKIGNVPDTLTEEQALKMKIVSRDTVYVNPYDEIFQGKKPADFLSKISIIPYSDNKEFILKAAIITKSSINVLVFEVSAPYDYYLIGLDKQLVRNLKTKAKDANKFEGLKVGSLDEPSTDGNWE